MSGKIEILLSNLISLKAGKIFRVTVVSVIILVDEVGKLVENLTVSMKKWKGRM